MRLVRRLQQVNTAARARRNVQHHYDLSGELYRLFLDEDMQYSCAYFERPDMTLEEAQLAKKRHIAAKLRIKPGQNVLDIGSGWGGLGLYLAKSFEADVLGVTLSTEQHAVATERARAEGLEDRVAFRDQGLSRPLRALRPHRLGRHVRACRRQPLPHLLRQMRDAAEAGRRHAAAFDRPRSGRRPPPPPSSASTFSRAATFPALSEVMPAIEKSGLMVGDIEILRLHYAETLKHWRERFLANRERAKAIYDERFCRMWEFYLAGSEAAFRWQDMMVFQIQLDAPERHAAADARLYGESAKRRWPSTRRAPAAGASRTAVTAQTQGR